MAAHAAAGCGVLNLAIPPGRCQSVLGEDAVNAQERIGLSAERAAEKQADRERDWSDIREGRRSVEQVNQENAIASGLMDRFRMRRELGVR